MALKIFLPWKIWVSTFIEKVMTSRMSIHIVIAFAMRAAVPAGGGAGGWSRWPGGALAGMAFAPGADGGAGRWLLGTIFRSCANGCVACSLGQLLAPES